MYLNRSNLEPIIALKSSINDKSKFAVSISRKAPTSEESSSTTILLQFFVEQGSQTGGIALRICRTLVVHHRSLSLPLTVESLLALVTLNNRLHREIALLQSLLHQRRDHHVYCRLDMREVVIHGSPAIQKKDMFLVCLELASQPRDVDGFGIRCHVGAQTVAASAGSSVRLLWS